MSARGPASQLYRSGFTLVEMLVVMVLLGLITSILFQGLGLIGKVQSRLIPNIQQQHQQMLQELWFRESVAGLSAGLSGSEEFTGTEYSFKGVSVSPLHSTNRAPQIIQWQINTKTDKQVLEYRQAQTLIWQIDSYPATIERPKFAYLDSNGQWQSQWNVRGSELNQSALPEAIALTYNANEDAWLVASIHSEKSRPWWLVDE